MSKSKRQSRVFTVSFPEDLARQVDSLAKLESRNISELLREAFRTYRMERIKQRHREDLEYARSRNPQGYTPDDVERLVKEIRAERRIRQKSSA